MCSVTQYAAPGRDIGGEAPQTAVDAADTEITEWNVEHVDHDDARELNAWGPERYVLEVAWSDTWEETKMEQDRDEIEGQAMLGRDVK